VAGHTVAFCMHVAGASAAVDVCGAAAFDSAITARVRLQEARSRTMLVD
jgi:hypothetical protein